MNEKGLSEALALLREIRDVGECSIDRWKRIDAFLASRQDEQHPEQAEGAQDEREAFILRMIEDRDISRTMAAYMWDSRQPAPAPELERPEVVEAAVLELEAAGWRNDDPRASVTSVSAMLGRIVAPLRYKAELYDEVWAMATGMGYMNVTTALDMLKRERDALAVQLDNLAGANEALHKQNVALAAQLAELKGQEPRTLRVVTDKPCPLWNPSATIDLHPVGDRCLHCEGTKFVVEYVPSPQPVAKEDGSDE
ncbi:hypothetical protein D3C76_47800 [compost metagenome]